jgi:hypothetical protein
MGSAAATIRSARWQRKAVDSGQWLVASQIGFRVSRRVTSHFFLLQSGNNYVRSRVTVSSDRASDR